MNILRMREQILPGNEASIEPATHAISHWGTGQMGENRDYIYRDRTSRDQVYIEDGPEVQRQHNVQRTIRLRRVGVVTGHIIAR